MTSIEARLNKQLVAFTRRNWLLAETLVSDYPYCGVVRLYTQNCYTFNHDREDIVVSDEEVHFLCSIGSTQSVNMMLDRYELSTEATERLMVLLADDDPADHGGSIDNLAS